MILSSKGSALAAKLVRKKKRNADHLGVIETRGLGVFRTSPARFL